jgi:hypothetical protein
MGIESLPVVSVRKLRPSKDTPGAVYCRLRFGWLLIFWFATIFFYATTFLVIVPLVVMAVCTLLAAGEFELWLFAPASVVLLSVVMFGVLIVATFRYLVPYMACGRGAALLISDESVTFLRGSQRFVVRGDAITEIRIKPASGIELVAPDGIARGRRPSGRAVLQIPGSALEASQSELARELARRFGER